MEVKPIAIIGIGCRFPGANNPQAFWKLLQDGIDVITEVPKSRWNNDEFYHPDATIPNKTNSRWGGFLDRIDEFDPHFFGISPREALTLDPQHRLLMEVAWEAGRCTANSWTACRKPNGGFCRHWNPWLFGAVVAKPRQRFSCYHRHRQLHCGESSLLPVRF